MNAYIVKQGAASLYLPKPVKGCLEMRTFAHRSQHALFEAGGVTIVIGEAVTEENLLESSSIIQTELKKLKSKQ